MFDFFDIFLRVITNLPRNYIKCWNVKLFAPIFGRAGERGRFMRVFATINGYLLLEVGICYVSEYLLP